MDLIEENGGVVGAPSLSSDSEEDMAVASLKLAPPDFYDFATSLPFRLDLAAALAYLFGPLGAFGLLLCEHQNDLVRFHAWQSLLASIVVLLGLISISVAWPRMLLPLLLLLPLFALYLAWLAYQRSASLRVFYLPWVGLIARHFTLNE